MSPDSLNIFYIIGSLLASAIFSGVEIAFLSANKIQVEVEKNQGKFTSRIVSSFYSKQSQFIATILIGNTLTLTIYGIFIAQVLHPFILNNLNLGFQSDILIFIIQTLVATTIVIVTAEFLPKSIFLINPNQLLTFFILPVTLFYYILFPFVYITVKLSKIIITKILKIDFSDEKPAFGITDLNEYVQRVMNSDENDDQHEIDTRIFYNALEFKSLKVRDCMVHRTEVVAVDINSTINELKEEFLETGHSKILIYEDSIDNIKGYCHSLALYKKPDSIKEIMTSMTIVPETMPANELLVEFISEHKSIALVVDEFGGTAGIITMEDVIEEILGDIQDEHDDDVLLEKQIDSNIFELSARHEIDYLNEKFKWNLPEGDYDTIGGLILNVFEDIPQENETIYIPGFTFTVLSTDNNKIESIRITIQNNE